jgi:hypothetical protein
MLPDYCVTGSEQEFYKEKISDIISITKCVNTVTCGLTLEESS